MKGDTTMDRYDDTVDRLAKAIASQINTVNDYRYVLDRLESVKNENMYAVAMIDLVSKYANQEIIMEYWALLQAAKVKKKKTSIFTKILHLIRRKKNNE